MKTIRLAKAGAVGDSHPEEVTIIIDKKPPTVKDIKSLEEVRHHGIIKNKGGYYDNTSKESTCSKK